MPARLDVAPDVGVTVLTDVRRVLTIVDGTVTEVPVDSFGISDLYRRLGRCLQFDRVRDSCVGKRPPCAAYNKSGILRCHNGLRAGAHGRAQGPLTDRSTYMSLASQRAHILTGAMYNDLTPELAAARERAVIASNAYNASVGRATSDREAFLTQLIGAVGAGAHFEPTFRCEFGYNISIGDRFYANFDCIILDGAEVTIGNDVLFGPRVSIYTANHALDPNERAAGACHAKPVQVGDRVWLGGGVTVNPGVTIGDNAVIAAGSVVTSDVPANAIAMGVPARVRRLITDADRTGYLDESSRTRD